MYLDNFDSGDLVTRVPPRGAASRTAAPSESRGSAEQAFVLATDDLVTLARRGLQSISIQDRDPTPRVTDQPGPLKGSGGLVDPGAAHTQHLRQELLGQQEVALSHPVVCR